MIYFDSVYKAFGHKVVLNDLSFHIPRNKITFIIGKSGEGKSVTIKHIMGLMKPDKGRVIVDGEDIGLYNEMQLRVYRKDFGMLFQQAALFDSLTVGENVAFPLREHSKLPEAEMFRRVEEVLEKVGLPALQHKYPNELSVGEKKRVGLARALIADPKILLYDEPTTGMDPLISEMIDELIVKINKDRGDLTSVVISHDLTAALATAEYLIMLYNGKVALAGTPREFESTKDPIVRQFFSGKVEGPMQFL